MSENLLKECPLLVALDKEKTIYDGFISVQVSLAKNKQTNKSDAYVRVSSAIALCVFDRKETSG